MQAVFKDSSTQKTDQHLYGAVVRKLPNSSKKINGQCTPRNGDEVAMMHWRGSLGTGKMLTIDEMSNLHPPQTKTDQKQNSKDHAASK